MVCFSRNSGSGSRQGLPGSRPRWPPRCQCLSLKRVWGRCSHDVANSFRRQTRLGNLTRPQHTSACRRQAAAERVRLRSYRIAITNSGLSAAARNCGVCMPKMPLWLFMWVLMFSVSFFLTQFVLSYLIISTPLPTTTTSSSGFKRISIRVYAGEIEYTGIYQERARVGESYRFTNERSLLMVLFLYWKV